MSTEYGWKVVCVDDTGVNTHDHFQPNGVVVKGQVYHALRRIKTCPGHGLIILGKPTFWLGIETGWNQRRFRTLSQQKHQTSQLERAAGVPRPVHTKPSAAGGPGPTRSGPVSHVKTQCTAAASIGGSTPSLTGPTSHTPSIFAAPTQFSYTADAGRSGAKPDKNGI